MSRRNFTGGAVATTITSTLSDSATSFSITSATGWPAAPFTAVIDEGTATEEKILVGARAGTALSSVTRGYDDTTAQAHANGAAILHVGTSNDFDEANALVNLPDAAGDTLYATAADTWARLAAGTARQALLMNAAATAPEWGASLASLLTAQADLPYASAANTPARLAKGTALQVLRMNAGATAPEWATAAGTAYVGARAYRTTNLSIADVTSTAVAWEAEELDSDAFHDNATNPSRFTVPAGLAGKYHLSGQIAWAGNATGERRASWRKNGATALRNPTSFPPFAGASNYHGVPDMDLDLAVGDYVELMVYQSSTAALNLLADSVVGLHRIGT